MTPSELDGTPDGVDGGGLDETQIHEVLSNERRRLVIELLQERDDGLTVRELSEGIAELETGESPPPTDARQSVYVSLQQTHVPKLDELDVVSYDEGSKTVALQRRASEVDVYMEVVPRYGISWSEYYLGVAILGLLTALASEVGVPFFVRIPPAYWGSLFLLVVVASALYRIGQQPRTALDRLRGG